MEKKKERKALPPFSWSFRDFFPLISVVDFFFPHCVCIRALDRAPPNAKKLPLFVFCRTSIYTHTRSSFSFSFSFSSCVCVCIKTKDTCRGESTPKGERREIPFFSVKSDALVFIQEDRWRPPRGGWSTCTRARNSADGK